MWTLFQIVPYTRYRSLHLHSIDSETKWISAIHKSIYRNIIRLLVGVYNLMPPLLRINLTFHNLPCTPCRTDDKGSSLWRPKRSRAIASRASSVAFPSWISKKERHACRLNDNDRRQTWQLSNIKRHISKNDRNFRSHVVLLVTLSPVADIDLRENEVYTHTISIGEYYRPATRIFF